MSQVCSDAYNGKVVANFIFTQHHVGKPECTVTIEFEDGSKIALKSESGIKLEDSIRTDVQILGGGVLRE